MQPGTGKAESWAPVVNRSAAGPVPANGGAATWAAPTRPDESEDALLAQYLREAEEVPSPERKGMLSNLERKPMAELLNILAGKRALRAQLRNELHLLQAPSGLEQRVNQLEDAMMEVRNSSVASLVSSESQLVKKFMDDMLEREHGRAMDDHYGGRGQSEQRVKPQDMDFSDLAGRLDEMLQKRNELGQKNIDTETEQEKADKALVAKLRDALSRYRTTSRRSAQVVVELQQAREELTTPLHALVVALASHNPIHGKIQDLLDKFAHKFEQLQIEQIRCDHQIAQAKADLKQIQPRFAALQESRRALAAEKSKKSVSTANAIKQWVEAHPKASSREVLAQIEIIEGNQKAADNPDYLQKSTANDPIIFSDAYVYQSNQASSQILPSLAGGGDLPADQQTMELLSQLQSSPSSTRILSQLQSSQASGQTLPLLRQLQAQLQSSDDGRQALPVIRDLLSHLQGNTYIDKARVGRVEEAVAQQMTQAGVETFLSPPVTLARVQEMQRRTEMQMQQNVQAW